jgi:glycosyltransferase involved in cell wall biosynthesis
MPNPVETPPFEEKNAFRPPVVVFAGELSRRKGLDVLLEVWPKVHDQVKDATLIIMGPPCDVTVSGGPGIAFRGLVAREQVTQALRCARVAVLPSIEEVQPMFLLEAMAAGAAVISTPVGGIPEIVGEDGLLVTVGDRNELCGALISLLSDGAKARALAELGLKRVRAEHSMDATMTALLNLYDSVMVEA